MPENTQPVPVLIAADLTVAAACVEECGLWTGPAYADPFNKALDPIAGLYFAATGNMPYIFTLPDPNAIDHVRAMVENNPRVWAAIKHLAVYVDALHSEPGPIVDPIETIAGWIDKHHITAEIVADALRAAALLLTAPVADRAA